MLYLKNISEMEEFMIKDEILAIARRMVQSGKYSKEFIIELTEVTEEGYIEAVKRSVIMECSIKLIDRFSLEFLQKTLDLNEKELGDLIKHKERKKTEME